MGFQRAQFTETPPTPTVPARAQGGQQGWAATWSGSALAMINPPPVPRPSAVRHRLPVGPPSPAGSQGRRAGSDPDIVTGW
jgi:hypothetical protein